LPDVEEILTKILTHLGLWKINLPEVWRVKARQPPKAKGPLKIQEYKIDHSTSQFLEFTSSGVCCSPFVWSVR